jgi:hypothetical protein
MFAGSLGSLSEETRDEASKMYDMFLINGVSPGCARVKVTELFSPPRITKELRRLPILNLIAGNSYDLQVDRNGQSWNFLRAEDRRRARKEIEKDKPYIVVGGPPCTAFASFNVNVNFPKMDANVVRRRRAEARTLLSFAAEIYELQRAAGRHFLHEHPETADSWKEPCIRRLTARRDVGTVVGHMCRMGLKTEDGGGRTPARKATRFMSTAGEILKGLNRKCEGGHAHRHLEGKKRTEAAAEYPRKMCRIVLKGIEAQRRREGHALPVHVRRELERGCGVYNLGPEEECREVIPEDNEELEKTHHESEGVQQWMQEQSFRDELTGEHLPNHLVRAAREEEITLVYGGLGGLGGGSC